jgi:hypothetical protein
MMKHGIKVDMAPPRYGGTGGITVEGELLPYCFDDEKLNWHISKPTQDDMDTLRWIELNPPALIGKEHIRRRKKIEIPTQYTMGRMEKAFGYVTRRCG